MVKTTNQRYKDEHYDKINFWIKKGLRDEYQRAAADFGISFRELVQRGVEMFIAEWTGENFHVQTITAQPTEKISPTQRRLLDAVEKLPADAQKSLLKFLESLSKAENTDKPADIP